MTVIATAVQYYQRLQKALMSDNQKFPRPLHMDFEKGLLQEDESWNASQWPKEETLCWDLNFVFLPYNLTVNWQFKSGTLWKKQVYLCWTWSNENMEKAFTHCPA